MRRTLIGIALVAAAAAAAASGAPGQRPADFRKDIEFALDEIEQQAGHFFKAKNIDWKKVRREALSTAKKSKTAQDHYANCVRLLARLRDGHAQVRLLEPGKGVMWPDLTERVGYGMFWCRVGKKVFVKNAWAGAKAVGIEPGMEVLTVDGTPAQKWLDARGQAIADLASFSTDQQQRFYTEHWGLSDAAGTRLKLKLKGVGENRKKTSTRTVTSEKANQTANGPAFYPGEVEVHGDLRFTKTEDNWGYVHVRRSRGELPTQFDHVLEQLANPPGLILDFRGNSGGGFDHDALFGRFIPTGKTISFRKQLSSAGEHSYGGPIVVIIDATVRSAGETASGMLKEDGRAYMIGESPTAGMSASKQTLPLPSGLFALYFAVRSNKARFNDGRGIEGVGVIPHEFIEFDPRDLAAGVDTLIRIAAERLASFPQSKVPYDPEQFGWKRTQPNR